MKYSTNINYLQAYQLHNVQVSLWKNISPVMISTAHLWLLF